jgi:antitoxin VapB
VPLTATEIRKCRWLGQRCAEAVEAVCRRLPRGVNERAVEALLSDALMRQAIRPARIMLASDERIAESGAAPPDDERKADRALLVSVCGRRWGLHVSLSRMIHFGTVPEELRRDAEAAAAVNADIWARCRVGVWFQGGEPGGAIGYRMQEWGTADRLAHTIDSGRAYAWSPAVHGVRMEDTILMLGENLEVLTRTPDWPVIEARASGRIYRLAAILSR